MMEASGGIQGVAEHPRRQVHDRDDPVVGHAGRADDPQHADRLAVQHVRCGHEDVVVQDVVPGLLADEDLHAFGPEALVQ
jgi:hypothetical protein